MHIKVAQISRLQSASLCTNTAQFVISTPHLCRDRYLARAICNHLFFLCVGSLRQHGDLTGQYRSCSKSQSGMQPPPSVSRVEAVLLPTYPGKYPDTGKGQHKMRHAHVFKNFACTPMGFESWRLPCVVAKWEACADPRMVLEWFVFQSIASEPND